MQCDYPLHLGLTEAGMGSKGIVASTAALSVLLQEGIGDTIRISLTPGTGRRPHPGSRGGQEILQTMGMRSFAPMVTAVPAAAAPPAPFSRNWRKASSPICARRCRCGGSNYQGVENMTVAVMGCVVNGPGECKLANIGISLPGTGESPAAPVYIDGEKVITLRGENIAGEFTDIVDSYVAQQICAARRRCNRTNRKAVRFTPF